MNCDFQRERAGNRLSLLRLVLQFYPFSVLACVLHEMWRFCGRVCLHPCCLTFFSLFLKSSIICCVCVCVCLQVSSVPLNRIDQIHVCFPPSSETLECAPKLVCLQHDTS